MPMPPDFSHYQNQLDTLRGAYNNGNLTLYLGAGVSVENGIPDWEQLVAAMYFSALSIDSDQYALTHAFRNYLFAIADWYLDRGRQPMDITARKIRAFYDVIDKKAFLPNLRDTLYASLTVEPGDSPVDDADTLLSANRTLQAVVDLCGSTSGVTSVISYNYDSLLELTLMEQRPVQPIWRGTQQRRQGRLPCYHVHGYIPIEGVGSRPPEIIFTEEQFNSAANTAYSWSNVVQLQQMASSVGLAIGLSLNDRNIRRLLDAVANTPLKPRVYAVLEREPPVRLKAADNKKIHSLAKQHLHRFSERARMKAPSREFRQVESIVKAVEQQDATWQEAVFRELGVEVLWVDSYKDLPWLLNSIT
jgi:hypothetical protein